MNKEKPVNRTEKRRNRGVQENIKVYLTTDRDMRLLIREKKQF